MAKLYLVPTPIGNLDDITLRAINVLRSVDLILAEDTRTTSFLLRHLGIEKPLKSHHKFNEHATAQLFTETIAAGRDVALVSDAGTPGISDPGFLLVRTCVEQGIEVETLPGATALIPALVNSGFPCDRFCFEGFLRRNIAIVLQDTVLFSNTIENNIKYANLDASDEEMVNAAEMSNIRRYIERQPLKYKTFLKQAGASLSHGQRQLMSIARAVLADPKILILDEATSSVDTRTEKKIQDAMVKLMKNRTSLIIAHRLSTIRDADKIVVMDQGRVVEMGNHEELLARQGKYYELYMTQFAGNKT